MTATSTRRGLKVALFATCANDVMFPQTPIATVELLERLGCRVEFPEEQTCCGQIFTNTGYYDEAMGSVKSYLKAFEKYEYIVGPSGSCVGSVRHQHEMLARRDAGDAIGDRGRSGRPHLRHQRVHRRCARHHRRRRLLPAPGDLPPVLPLGPDRQGGRQADAAAEGSARHHRARPAQLRAVLWHGRHLLAEEPGRVDRDGQRQGKECGQHRCRVPRGR